MDQDLPEWLTERTRWLVRPDQTDHGPGQFVLYWMHSALRAHHNPALDVAICLARQNGLPLLIYHGLSENYPFASDRHHAFILQGARDVQHEMSQRGLPYVFHLQRQGDRGPHLRDLTRRAAVLVSEEMPVEPVIGWIERLTQITSTPIAAVDTSCVLPIRAYEGPVDLAYRFRRATKSEYQKRLQTPYAEQPADCVAYDGPLPFQPLDLQRHCIASLLKDCRIDHSVAPVTETPGGSRAGYQRWERFFANGLEKYQRMRGRAGNRESVSRLSAYFHYGMISPLRIAQRALELRASKYVNQLMIWRELAFHFCARQPDRVESLECLPAWAQRTLI
ncbi:MAG: deoxyribodipyrimidine photo-lyase, partial [Planctomycetota bacterium]